VTGYVLDTSVVIKWFSVRGESDLPNALQLRDELYAGKCSVTVPDLLFYEIANALRYNPNFTGEDVQDALLSLANMDLLVRRFDSLVSGKTLELAYRFGITVYDACFLALAKTEEMNLVTADYKFFRQAEGAGNIVRLDELHRDTN